MTCNECEHGQLRRSCEICELRAELNGMNREAEEQSLLIERQAAEIARLRQRIESAPLASAFLDERGCPVLSCDFEEGKRVRLVVESDETP